MYRIKELIKLHEGILKLALFNREIYHQYKLTPSGVMVIVAGIGHGDTSSNPGLIAFHIALIPLGKVWIQVFSLQLWVNSRAD